MIKRLDHVAISVADLDRSIAFYSRHFGLDPYFVDRNRVGSRLEGIAYMRSAQGVLELMLRRDAKMSDAYHFCFVTDDFRATFDRLVEEGVPVKQQPHPTAAREPGEESWLRCVFSGPDGEEVEIRGPGPRSVAGAE
jgi:catechol 2,3-dioxygenase-like lactoylglutathione lyase family enzyme